MGTENDMPHLEKLDFREQYKVFYDFFKHLTTLSTGSILLLATLLKDLFKSPEWSPLVAVSFVCFTLTILGSVVSMLMFGSQVVHQKAPEGGSANFLIGFLIAVGILFFAAVLALVMFTLKNLM